MIHTCVLIYTLTQFTRFTRFFSLLNIYAQTKKEGEGEREEEEVVVV